MSDKLINSNTHKNISAPKRDWVTLMEQAKAAYDNNHYERSIYLNQEALLLSTKGFDTAFIGNNPRKAIDAILTAYLNISDSQIALKSYTASVGTFEAALNFLQKIQEKDYQVESQQLALLQGMQQLYYEWSIFLKEYTEELPGTDHAEQALSSRFSCMFDLHKTRIFQ